MNVFESGFFKLNSGFETYVKIECDDLTDEDIETFAYIIHRNIFFRDVVSVPTGGDRIASALAKFKGKNYKHQKDWCDMLIVDDVWTTGKSMAKKWHEVVKTCNKFDKIKGIVLFARDDIVKTNYHKYLPVCEGHTYVDNKVSAIFSLGNFDLTDYTTEDKLLEESMKFFK